MSTLCRSLRPLGLALMAGCHLIGGTDGLYIVDAADGGGGAGAAGGASTTSSTTGGGGADGGAPGCDPATCPGEDTECSQRACLNGECGVVSSMPGTPCRFNGGRVCDGGGQCVDCVVTEHCMDSKAKCLDLQCLSQTCDDGLLSDDESDVDCGGDCVPCDNDKMCKVATDCKSNICQAGFCIGCTDHGDCQDITWYCELSSGLCKMKKLPGGQCSEDYECITGNCGDIVPLCLF